MILLSFLFALTAFIYSTVGFAGGSTYLALLTLWGITPMLIPALALSCNIIVSTANSIQYLKAKLLCLRLLIPHSILAIPCAYIGGGLHIDKSLLQIFIAASLLIAALSLLITYKKHNETREYKIPPLWLMLLAGAVLGFLSGVVGIGGGIFLAPLLYVLSAANPKEIASTSSMFIFLNSIAGLAGQLHKFDNFSELLDYWPLPLAVFIGGRIGNTLTLKILSLKQIAFFTAVLLMIISLRLWFDIFRL